MKITDILMYNGYIITMNESREIIPDGAIVISDGQITAIGKTAEIRKEYPHAEHEIDAQDHAILPGFVNTHAHNFQVLLKSLGDDMKLMDWSPQVIVPITRELGANECYWAGMASSLESIRGGITTTVDFHYAHKDWNNADKILEAYVKTGIRGIESRCVQDSDRFGLFNTEDPIWEPFDMAIKYGRDFIRNWRGKANGRVTGWFGPGAVWTCSDEMIREAINIAEEEDTMFPFHFNETMDEVQGWKKKMGVQPIEYTYNIDPRAGKRILAVHCVWVDEKEISIMKKTDMKVSYNPLSNMYLASGIAPISRFITEGITVSLGADGQASNNGQDHFELIRTAVLLQKVGTHDPQAMSPEKALEIATIDGAKAIGKENEIGSLEVGKKADIISVALKTPNMVAINRIPSQIVYCGKSNDLVTVIVDGKILLHEKQFVELDEPAILDKTQQIADELIDRAGCLNLRDRPWTSLPKVE